MAFPNIHIHFRQLSAKYNCLCEHFDFLLYSLEAPSQTIPMTLRWHYSNPVCININFNSIEMKAVAKSLTVKYELWQTQANTSKYFTFAICSHLFLLLFFVAKFSFVSKLLLLFACFSTGWKKFFQHQPSDKAINTVVNNKRPSKEIKILFAT